MRANVNEEDVVKCAMKEIDELCDVVFWEQCTDPFEDGKDCVEALLEVDPLGEFDQEWEDGVDEMLKIEVEFSGLEPELEEEGEDQRRTELKDNRFEQQKDEYRSRNVGMTDDCAHTCQLSPETKVQESQDGSVASGKRCGATHRNLEQTEPRRT